MIRIPFVCLGFYAVSTVFQLFKGDSSQIRVSWTIFNKYLTSPLSWRWWASRSAISIILSAKGESRYNQLLVCHGQESNPRPPAHEAGALTTRPSRRSIWIWAKNLWSQVLCAVDCATGWTYFYKNKFIILLYLERPPREREVVGSIPGRKQTKVFKTG